jgi:hypothetical protein
MEAQVNGFSNNSYIEYQLHRVPDSGGSNGDEAMAYQGMVVQALPAQGMALQALPVQGMPAHAMPLQAMEISSSLY